MRSTVVLAKRIGGILQSSAEGVNLLFLLLDFFIENLISCCESLGRFVVLVELRIHKLHFRAKHLERIIDFSEGFLKFTLALKTYF